MGKGGSTNSVEYPAWLEDAARRNLDQADRISRIGSVPMSYGPTVAAFTPMQNSSFANTASMANAFGLDAPTGTAVTGGLDAPTTYANGVTAYSALPIYKETMDEFKLDRPGQASYIDSFFIDPFSGQPGSNVASVAATPTSTASTPSSTVSSGGSGDTDYSPGTDAFYNPGNRTNFAEGVSEGALGFAENANKDVFAIGYKPGQMSPREAAEKGLIMRDDNPFDYSITDHMKSMAGDVKDIASNIPTPLNVLSNTSPAGEDLPGNAITRTLNIGAGKKDASSSSGYAGKADDGCVIATHAISTGVYNYQTRREAEVWCMRRLHNKWWGETIRRGYRYLGRQKIDQGKASEHYDEFKRYIAFATGKKRDLRGALTFTLRSVQFFAVGLFARNS